MAASALVRRSNAVAHISIHGHYMPTMLMAYVGALKAWISAPIFLAFPPSALSLRLPGLLLGSVTVCLVFLLLERMHSRTAAWIGTLLLATDATYLLTTCFDWGPVVLQHLLATAGMLALVVFYQRRQLSALAWGAFCFGLALWDKALFAWLGGGLTLATLLVYPRQLWQTCSPKHLRVAALGFTLGAFPLIAFNVMKHFPTFHATAGFTSAELPTKALILWNIASGHSLLGYLTQVDTAPQPRQPGNTLERFSFWLHAHTGDHSRNGLNAAFLAALLCLPLIRRTAAFRPALFCLITLAVAWLQMGITREAGGAAHHIVLLWPIPMLLIGVVFAQLANSHGRMSQWIIGVIFVCLITTNLLLINQYFYELVRNGAAGAWSDAIYSLAEGLPHAGASKVAVVDWGISLPLDFLDKGSLPLVWAGDPFLPAAPGAAPRPDPPASLLHDPKVIWVAHTNAHEQFSGVNAGVDAFARRAGFDKIPIAIYNDRNGRPVFQTFRLIQHH